MNYGKIIGELATEYHATDAVGSHKLQDFVRSPLLYYRKYVSKEAEPEEQSPAFAFGEYLHCLALEGEEVAMSQFIVAPDGIDRRTTVGKNEWAGFQSRAAGRKIIKSEDDTLARLMVERIREKKTCVKLLSRGSPEVTFRKKMASFSVQCRCDWWSDENGPLILDLKSIDSTANFDRQFEKYSYYTQAAHYQLVVNAVLGLGDVYPRFVFIVADKEEPFDVSIREPDQISLDIGRRQVMADLARLKHAYETGQWPGEPDEIRPVSLPEWKIMKEMT